ncbi:MAG: C_GCAxxG_C_C family protein [Candidatus Krumholzibacteriota bacterium]|nr:C_GCAxxG_C_C family protein [Candidatus Krumholzibacteriota bacterium]
MTESKGLVSELIPKIATGFCAGISRTGYLCGALSGAIMAVSIFMGRNSPAQSAEQCYEAVQRLKEIFNNRFGSVNCLDLTGCDLATERGQRAFEDDDLHEKCSDYVSEAAGFALDLIGGND